MRYPNPTSRPGAAMASITHPYCFQAVSASRQRPDTAHTKSGTTDDSPSRHSESNNQGGINA